MGQFTVDDAVFYSKSVRVAGRRHEYHEEAGYSASLSAAYHLRGLLSGSHDGNNMPDSDLVGLELMSKECDANYGGPISQKHRGQGNI